MKILVASKNPVKINAVKDGFVQLFGDEQIEITGEAIQSGVKDQPFSDEETLSGAENRVLNAQNQHADFDYFVGIEGGISYDNNEMQAFAWIVIASNVTIGKARTTTFVLPSKIAEYVNAGYELGEADDMVFGSSNSKQKNGAIGLLTQNTVTRQTLYSQAVIAALIPFVNKELY